MADCTSLLVAYIGLKQKSYSTSLALLLELSCLGETRLDRIDKNESWGDP